MNGAALVVAVIVALVLTVAGSAAADKVTPGTQAGGRATVGESADKVKMIRRTAATEHLFAPQDTKGDGVLVLEVRPTAAVQPAGDPSPTESYAWWDWSGSINIPDGPNGAWVGINCLEPSGLPAGSQVTRVSVHHEITHTWIGDLEVQVYNAQTSHVWTVRNREGGSADNINETRPEDFLFDGDDPIQEWYYRVRDMAGRDTGTLDVMQLYVYYDALGEIRGSKWSDLNGDGVWDGDEPGLANWRIYVDQNANGSYDAGEPENLTDADGRYVIDNLPSGIHIVAEEAQEDWVQTFPEDAGGAALPMAAQAADDTTDRFSWGDWEAVAGPAMDDPAAAKAGDEFVGRFKYAFKSTPQIRGPKGKLSVSLPGESLWKVADDPIVPVRYAAILLPQGTEIAGVQIEPGPGVVVAEGVEGLPATPKPRPIGRKTRPADDSPLSSTSESFPVAGQVLHSTVTVRGYSVGLLRIFPMSYDAKAKTVIHYPSLSLTVSTRARKGKGMLGVRHLPADLQAVGRMVDNDSALSAYAAEATGDNVKSGTLPPGGPFDYVVITSTYLESSFQPLVDHKIASGLSAITVTTSYIYSNYTGTETGDNQDRIRDFIRDAFTTWNTQWVLLGGDIDEVPYRGGYGYVNASGGAEIDNNIPTDMYFACLDGPWNNDGDAIWGESNDGNGGSDVDLAPDVHIGRAPASDTAEAQHFVGKTILYATTAHPNPKQAVWLGENLDTQTWGGNSKEIIKNSCLPPTWTVTERYERDGPWSRSDFVGDLNANPHIINHNGHANATYNAKLVNSDVDGLTNTHPYFMYSIGCISGSFDVGDCIAEHHVVYRDSGAFGVIMNSRYGWYSPGTTGGPSHDYDLAFWDAVFNENLPRTGQAQTDAKLDLLGGVGGTGADRWVHFCSNLLGDPEVALRLVQQIPGTHLVNLGPGQSVDNINFGNRGDFDPEITVQTEDDLDWVYQNTPDTMANGGHKVLLWVNVLDYNGNGSVSVTVEKVSGSGPGEVTIEDNPENDPLEKLIFGSMRTDGIADAGDLVLRVTATGDMAGRTTVEVPFTCRRLGDVNGATGVDPTDVAFLVLWLNGNPPQDISSKAVDLDSNGGPEPKDLGILFNILNGLPVP